MEIANYPFFSTIRGGKHAVILANAGIGNKPLIGAYYNGADEWIPMSWTKEGKYNDGTIQEKSTNLDFIMEASAEEE